MSRRPEVPWADDIDFGKEYAPHELVARAFDEKGTEIALARQWINLPRPAAEVEILLDRDASGKAVAARLVWASRMGPKPESLSLTMDGRELPVDALHEARLPSYDVTAAHVLTAQVEFAHDVGGRADLVLGGGSVDETGSELTAVPVRSADGKIPNAEQLRGRFLKNGKALRVTGVEHGPAELILVRDTTAGSEFDFRVPRGNAEWDGTGVANEDRLRVMWPVARQLQDVDASNVLFESSAVFLGSKATLRTLLRGVAYPGRNVQPRRFADAVAVAGLQAASYSRRAVILILGLTAHDESRADPKGVRAYLERLRVPLYVWSLANAAKVPAAAWGSYDGILALGAFRQLAEHVRADLDSQSIVWLAGRHLPQDIVLVDAGDGLSLVR